MSISRYGSTREAPQPPLRANTSRISSSTKVESMSATQSGRPRRDTVPIRDVRADPYLKPERCHGFHRNLQRVTVVRDLRWSNERRKISRGKARRQAGWSGRRAVPGASANGCRQGRAARDGAVQKMSASSRAQVDVLLISMPASTFICARPARGWRGEARSHRAAAVARSATLSPPSPGEFRGTAESAAIAMAARDQKSATNMNRLEGELPDRRRHRRHVYRHRRPGRRRIGPHP